MLTGEIQLATVIFVTLVKSIFYNKKQFIAAFKLNRFSSS
jgi:hypothetical protein